MSQLENNVYRNKTRLTKSQFILGYFIIISSFFEVKPFGYLQELGRGFPILIIAFLWLAYGYYVLSNNGRPLSGIDRIIYKKSHVARNILLSILPSMFMAYIMFHQSLFQSVITYRHFILLWAIPVLLKLHPSENDLIKAINRYAVMFFCISIIRTVTGNELFVVSEKEIEYYSGDNGWFIFPHTACYPIILLSLYYYCIQLWKQYKGKYMLYVILYFGLFVFIQNRSTLFPALVFIVITILKCKFRSKVIKPIFIVFCGSIGLYLSGSVITSLIEETNTQVTSTYDPRIVAMAYFLDFSNMSPMQILFGTGEISYATSSYMKDLQEASIHYSDVGFVGFWHEYGLFSVIIFASILLKCLFSNKQPWNSRFLALHILICSVTISYFGSSGAMLWFILFYYQYCYYKGHEDLL